MVRKKSEMSLEIRPILTNVSFCRECYDLFISNPLTMLNENARLELDFGKEETND